MYHTFKNDYCIKYRLSIATVKIVKTTGNPACWTSSRIVIRMFSELRFRLIIWFSRMHQIVLRISGGRLMHSLKGLDILLLSHKGRHTGTRRYSPLLYVEHNNRYYCAASFAGSDKNPQWFLNVTASPDVELSIKRIRLKAIAHVTSGLERNQAWEELIAYYPAFTKYQIRTARTIPVVRFDPTSDSRNDQDQTGLNSHHN